MRPAIPGAAADHGPDAPATPPQARRRAARAQRLAATEVVSPGRSAGPRATGSPLRTRGPARSRASALQAVPGPRQAARREPRAAAPVAPSPATRSALRLHRARAMPSMRQATSHRAFSTAAPQSTPGTAAGPAKARDGPGPTARAALQRRGLRAGPACRPQSAEGRIPKEPIVGDGLGRPQAQNEAWQCRRGSMPCECS